MTEPGHIDVLVVGSGVAGLSAAVRLATAGRSTRVAVLTKGELSQSATRWAQGGVAAVLGGDEDSTDLHFADTLAAGAGLCDPTAVRVLVDEGPARVEELIAMGAQFDRESSGSLALAREGGHSRARVVHAGGAATGVEVERALVAAVGAAATVLEGWFALDLLVAEGRCAGVLALSPEGRMMAVRAEQTVLATGGIGQLYAVTTNPPESTGDGIAMALRAGVAVADVELVQFHPTALHHPAMPRPLLSEALRGHGALLRDARGERFVDELAPRDVVSRAMASKMAVQAVDHLWLDATVLERFGERFPTIAASLSAAGLDPAVDWLPIAPAAHHVSGGVVTDLWGASAMPGLWAVGEAACTGVHGANRLASNSLLEGMVFGARAAEALTRGADGPTPTGAMRPLVHATADGRDDVIAVRRAPAGHLPTLAGPLRPDPVTLAKAREELQRAMTSDVGVVRTAAALSGAASVIEEVASVARGVPGPRAAELANLATIGAAVVGSALAREESRGAHTRSEHPGPDPAWRCRLVHVREEPGVGARAG